ncbi:unnamed protein product [Cercospora beticola]|nr:unnamed protein product [Cercospora beticola]
MRGVQEQHHRRHAADTRPRQRLGRGSVRAAAAQRVTLLWCAGEKTGRLTYIERRGGVHDWDEGIAVPDLAVLAAAAASPQRRLAIELSSPPPLVSVQSSGRCIYTSPSPLARTALLAAYPPRALHSLPPLRSTQTGTAAPTHHHPKRHHLHAADPSSPPCCPLPRQTSCAYLATRTLPQSH